MVDREAAVAALNGIRDQAAGAGTTAVAVITGAAGVGKSVLGLTWAYLLRPGYPGGQLYANLHADQAGSGTVVSPEAVLGDFLYALGVPPELIPAGLPRRLGLYRTVTQNRAPLLVMLDDALSAAQVRQLLPASATSLTVVTSRHLLTGLRLDGAQAVRLDRLESGPALRLITDMVGTRRLGREPRAAAEVVELCAGHPLALSIVAARLAAHPSWPLADMVTALRQRRLATLSLEGGENMAVAAALDSTYDVLTPESARLYRLLALVPGDTFSRGAIAALADISGSEAEHLLERLTDVNLLIDIAPGRYRFSHSPIREHAHEKATHLADQIRQAAIARLFGWYLHTAARAECLLRPYRRGLPRDAEPAPGEVAGFADPPHALQWLETERGNLAAAIQAAYDRGRFPVAWQLADAMWALFLHRGHHMDRLPVEETALAAARACHDRYAEAKMWDRLGASQHHLGRHAQAADSFIQARGLWEELGEAGRAAGSQRRLGWVAAALDDSDKAIACFTAAADAYDRLGEDRETALALTDLACGLIATGRTADALTHLDRARGLLAGINDPHNQARLQMMLGRARTAAGAYTSAAADLKAALAEMTRLDSSTGRFEVLRALGELAERTGQPGDARAHYEQALQAISETGTTAHARIRHRIDRLTAHPAPAENGVS